MALLYSILIPFFPLIGKPKLSVLDEPANAIIPVGTREILTFLQQSVKNDALTVFISTRLTYEVKQYCDRDFVMCEQNPYNCTTAKTKYISQNRKNYKSIRLVISKT